MMAMLKLQTMQQESEIKLESAREQADIKAKQARNTGSSAPN